MILAVSWLVAWAAAAPRLELSATSVGPVPIVRGSSGKVITIEAFNLGDGSLNLRLTAAAPWLKASAGEMRPCAYRAGDCLALQLSFQTSALGPGAYETPLTVEDASAIDAPQEVRVQIQVGSGVPRQIRLVASSTGAPASATFVSDVLLEARPGTRDGRPWLSIALDGAEGDGYGFRYRVTGQRRQGMTDGDYAGSISVRALAASVFEDLPALIDVALHVKSGIILEANPPRLYMRVTEKTATAQSQSFLVANRGMGHTLLVGSGNPWFRVDLQTGMRITFETAGGDVFVGTVVVDVQKGAPGIYSAVIPVSTGWAREDVLSYPLPMGTPAGDAFLRLVRQGKSSNTVSFQVASFSTPPPP